MGSKSKSGGTTIVRYAGYIESQHKAFLSLIASYRNDVIDDSPFSGYVDVEVENAFFGLGYTISSFPSLYDMYGKFMAGLDIDSLWDQIFEDTVNSSLVGNLVTAQADLLDDEITTTSLPRMQEGMRDINSVIASSFVIGKAIIEDGREKTLAKLDAELKYKLIPVAESRWQTHLQWNQQVVSIYSEIMKFYFAAKHDVNEDNYSFAAKDKLWPFTVLEFERAALGALQGATNTRSDAAGTSTTARVLAGALSGASMGAMVGSNITSSTSNSFTTTSASGANTYSGAGAVVGAAVGIAAALTY